MMNATAERILSEPQPIAGDYEVVRRILAVITEHWRRHPSIDEIAQAVGSTPTEVHHLFRRLLRLTSPTDPRARRPDPTVPLVPISRSMLPLVT